MKGIKMNQHDEYLDYDRLTYDEYYDNEDDFGIDCGFADPSGHSALRAVTENNPRNLSCPTCEKPYRLTPADVRLGYQCDDCADRAERNGY
jgi:hypothetical protein